MKPVTIAAAALVVFFFLNAESEAQTDKTDAAIADRAAIGQTMAAFVNAWNAHDARALALTFTPDADFTNVLGAHAHGRAGIESFHAPVFATIFKESHLTGVIRSIRFLTSQLAAVDTDWQMTGAQSPGGSPAPLRRGLTDWVMQRQVDGSWLIEVMHNTNLPPENTTPPK
ncbi:MAG: SgcJ/EcaC family oxidoreductase [Candidatus Cybelea sp.]|jgi:uncharacterized protein (TIGR02246 family)